jgi:hypothetical protein
MSKYKLSLDEKSVYTTREDENGNTVLIQIPVDENNADYQEYLVWLDAGNIPDPADLPPTPDPQEQIDADTLDALKAQYIAIKSGMTTISGHCDSILGGPAAPTAGQTGTALKTLAGDMKQILNGMDKMLDAIAVIVRRIRG